MPRGRRRKCKCCLKLFRPDPCNRRHQRYCSPRCRRASKAASQARWLRKPENQDYFRDPWHAARVRAWRSRNPGYWRKAQRPATALQDVSKESMRPSKCPHSNLRHAGPRQAPNFDGMGDAARRTATLGASRAFKPTFEQAGSLQ